MTPVKPRAIVEAARIYGVRKSRNLITPSLVDQPINIAIALVQHRRELVMDCYLTGVEEMLRLLHGDAEPEPWREDYDHEERLRELLNQYGLNAEKPIMTKRQG